MFLEAMVSLKAVVFDMDGTITKPVLDFAKIRAELGFAGDEDLAVLISQLSDEKKYEAWSVIHKHEANAMVLQELQPGFLELLSFCRLSGVKVGVLTLNLRKSVDRLCERFGLEFDGIVTREFEFTKPSPKPLQHLMKQWQVDASETLMVGDYIHDLDCANQAGAISCYFFNQGTEDFSDQANYCVKNMAGLKEILKNLIER
jgi:HAD superfamily hydrolase (TIGR01549 family)